MTSESGRNYTIHATVIHATVGSITRNPHYRSVEYQSWSHLLSITGGEYRRWGMCLSNDLNMIFRRYHCRCVCPLPHVCFGRMWLTTVPNHKRSIMYRYEAPYENSSLASSLQNYLVSLRQLHFVVWGPFFFSAKIGPFSALPFILQDVSKNRM